VHYRFWGDVGMESPLRALIVDDAEMSRLITRRIISKVFICDDAENGLIAVSKFREAIDNGAPYYSNVAT